MVESTIKWLNLEIIECVDHQFEQYSGLKLLCSGLVEKLLSIICYYVAHIQTEQQLKIFYPKNNVSICVKPQQFEFNRFKNRLTNWNGYKTDLQLFEKLMKVLFYYNKHMYALCSMLIVQNVQFYIEKNIMKNSLQSDCIIEYKYFTK